MQATLTQSLEPVVTFSLLVCEVPLIPLTLADGKPF